MSTSAVLCEICQAPAPQKCSGCLLVSYCGKQHQRQDWPEHRSKCRAYEIRFTPELGQYLVASRDLEEGVVIMTEFPFVVGPRHFLPETCCVGCCRKVNRNPKVCRRCNWPVCSNNCPGLRSPSSHDVECIILKFINKSLSACPNHFVMPLRCALLQTQNLEKWRWIEERFPFAEAGKEDVDEDFAAAVLQSYLPLLPSKVPYLLFDCSPSTVRKLVNVLDTYALDFGSTRMVAPFGGLYAVASLLRHSCASNTFLLFEAPGLPESAQKFISGEVTVKAARNIKQGEILTRNSNFACVPTLARLGTQKTRRNFRCSCARCVDPHENGIDFGTLRCNKCSGLLVPVNTDKIEFTSWRCEGPCKMSMSAQETSNVLEAIMNVGPASLLKEIVDVGALEQLLSIYESHCHTNHFLCFAVKCRLLKMYGRDAGVAALDDADLQKKAALGRNIVELMTKLGPSQIHQEVINKAECILEVAKAEMEIMKRRFYSGAWSSSLVSISAFNCISRLQRTSSFLGVTPGRFLNSHYQNTGLQISYEIIELISWLKKNDIRDA